MECGKITFISWAPYCSRSDAIARELNAKSYMVYCAKIKSDIKTILFKYLLQGIKTLKILLKEQPQIVFCMTPPIFAAIPVWLYTKLFRNAGYVFDYHTAAFVMKLHQRLFFVQRFFAKQAIINIVTNNNLAEIVKAWGGDVVVIGDVKVVFSKISDYPLRRTKFNIVFVSSFSPTEPIDIVYEVANNFQKENKRVQIYITGSVNDAPEKYLKSKPKNVIFTDFLSDADYAGLLKNANAVMALCKNDNTMQRGAYEAMSLESPIIISDWKLLRETFYMGAVYVKNEAKSIQIGIEEMMENQEKYRKEMKILKDKRWKIWYAKKQMLIDSINKKMDIKLK